MSEQQQQQHQNKQLQQRQQQQQQQQQQQLQQQQQQQQQQQHQQQQQLRLRHQVSVASSINNTSCLRCQLLVAPLSQCVKNTTIEGLPNLISAGSLWRKIVWMIILLSVLSACTWHMVQLFINFKNSGVSSTITIDAQVVEFPDVTVCGLTPISESFIYETEDSNSNYNVTEYMKTIDNWFADESRLRRKDETLSDYTERMENLFLKMFELVRLNYIALNPFFNMNYDSSILQCKFKDIPCQPSNFTLIHHNELFNCLTFSPDERHKMADSVSDLESDLQINVFTDSSILESDFRSDIEYHESSKTYYDEGMTLGEYLTAHPKKLQINKLLAQKGTPNGVMVILHPRKTYPFNDHQGYILQTGSSGVLRVSTTEQHRLSHKVPCSNEPPGEVLYNNFFTANIGTNKFVRIPEDALHDVVQQELFDHCRCYSHRVPSGSGAKTTSLCYHVPNNDADRRMPLSILPKEIAERIACHDRWLPEAKKAAASKVQLKRPCDFIYREVQLDSIDWPSDDDIVEIANSFIRLRLRKLASPEADNFDSGKVNATIRAMVDLAIENCSKIQDLLNNNDGTTARCYRQNVVKENVVRLIVKLDSPYTVAYNESYVYDWTELLSEVGGVIGLWFGMSLLTVFELVDLVWIIATWESQTEALEERDDQSLKQVELVLDDSKKVSEFITSGCSVFVD